MNLNFTSLTPDPWDDTANEAINNSMPSLGDSSPAANQPAQLSVEASPKPAQPVSNSLANNSQLSVEGSPKPAQPVSNSWANHSQLSVEGSPKPAQPVRNSWAHHPHSTLPRGAGHSRIPSETVEEIKSRANADIENIISDRVTLRPSGKSLVGECPFHTEGDKRNSRSFSVTPSKSMYHCFKCGAGGDAIKFLMETGQTSFIDVIKDLARHYNISLPEAAPTLPHNRIVLEREVQALGEPQLWPTHRDHLYSEGFTTEQIELLVSRGVRSLTEQQAARLGFTCKGSDGQLHAGSGLYFPFTQNFGQLRLDLPIVREGGATAKYLTPAGAVSAACIPDRCRAVTEGYKDACAGTLHGGIPTAGIAGVTHYKKALTEGAGYTTIFDSDGWTNPAVMLNLIRCGQYLKGKINLIPEIPGQPKAGLCEFFKAGYTAADYQRLIDEAYTPKELLLEWAKRFASIPQKKLSEALKTAIRLAAELLDSFEQLTLLEWLKKATKIAISALRDFLGSALRQLQIERQGEQNNSDGFLHSHRYGNIHENKYLPICQSLDLTYENLINGTTFDDFIYQQFSAQDYRVIDSAYYLYAGEGAWQYQSDSDIYSDVCAWGEAAYKLKHTKELGWLAEFAFKTNNHTESAFKYSRKKLHAKHIPANNHLLAFKNGTVDVRTGKVMPHNKEHFLTRQIPFDYIENAECPVAFRQFVSEVYGEEMLPLMQAIISGMLDPTAPYGWFAHFIGSSGSGKGTTIRLLGKMFGLSGYRSGASFAELATPEGRHQHLTGCSLYALPDVGGYMEGLKSFYELVDNGPMSGRPLYQSHAYEKVWGTRFAIGSVNYLQVENSGDGWERRCRPFPTKPRTKLPDPDLEAKLEAVLGEIIGWALAMERAERDRLLLIPDAAPDNVTHVRYEASLYADSVKYFVDRALRPCEEAEFINDALLHSLYAAFCKEHGLQPLSQPRFTAHLKNVLPKNHVARRWSPMVNGFRRMLPSHWQGIGRIEGAFVDLNAQQQNPSPDGNNFGGSQQSQYAEPLWKCNKTLCVEGGFFEFEQFWNPPPPSGGSLGKGTGGGNPPGPNFSSSGSGWNSNGSEPAGGGSNSGRGKGFSNPSPADNSGNSSKGEGGYSAGSGSGSEQMDGSKMSYSPESNQIKGVQVDRGVQNKNLGISGEIKNNSPLPNLLKSELKTDTRAIHPDPVAPKKAEIHTPSSCTPKAKLTDPSIAAPPNTTNEATANHTSASQVPPFPQVGEQVLRKRDFKYPPLVCTVVEIGGTNAKVIDSQGGCWNISIHAWAEGLFVPYRS